jgi:hypothetical protein
MDNDFYKDIEEEGFWFEMQSLAGAFAEICHRYDVDDRVISVFMVGLLEPKDEETSNMKAFFHYNMQSEEELDIVKDFITDSYVAPENEGPDLGDLLNGLDISLN